MSTIVVASLDPGDRALRGVVNELGVETVAIQDLDRRLAAGGVDGVVVVSDGVDSDVAVRVAGMLGEGSPPAIEVHSERWDGFQHSLLSESCQAVISGFGIGGVVEAVKALREQRS